VCWVDRCRWCDDSGAHIDEAQVGGTKTTSYIAIFVSQVSDKRFSYLIYRYVGMCRLFSC
jgi:hypothetical protein